MLKKPTRSALRAPLRATIQNVHGDTQDDTSERSERVLNSAMLIENGCASVRVLQNVKIQCNAVAFGVHRAILIVWRG